MKNVNLLVLISRILFPNYPPHYFLFYMFAIYILKRKKYFKLVMIPNELLLKYAKTHGVTCYDINNCVMINRKYLRKSLCAYIYDPKTRIERLAFCIGDNIDDDIVLVNKCLFNNLKIHGFKDHVQIKEANISGMPVALEVELSLVSSPYDLSNSVIDCILKNYFKTLRFISEGDVICLSIKEYGMEYFYTNYKVNMSSVVYFKCNKVQNKANAKRNTSLCVYGETTLKQAANVQSFIPTQDKIVKFGKLSKADQMIKFLVNNCPFGLEVYAQKMEKAMKPFFNNKRKNFGFHPIFLVYGREGFGQNIILSSLSFKLGLHFYRISSTDLSATIYSQNETKLKNIFFKARLSSPCLLVIDHFESFGKNNEGQYDKRIIESFKNETVNLFSNQNYPLFLFCISESREIPSDLSRIFLETFEIAVPNESERALNIQWILELYNVKHDIDINDVVSRTQGFVFEDLVTLILRARRHTWEDNLITKDSINSELELMRKEYSKNMGTPEIPKVHWSDVGGLDDVKSEIIRTINLPLKFAKAFESSTLKRSGILLYGPPGTGKTLLAKAVATECNLCFLSVKGPELLNMYVGQSEQNIREVFEKARQASPCIIFFDELDSLAPNRGNAGDSGGVMDRIVSQLLAEMDGLNKTGFVFIIGATNRPDLIDPALLRPGRFDKLLYVGPCTDKRSQLNVLRALTRRFKLTENTNLEDIVNFCPSSVSGADFYGLASNAWMSAVKRLINEHEKGGSQTLKSLTAEDVIVDIEDFKAALKTLKPSIKPEDLLYYESLKRQLS